MVIHHTSSFLATLLASILTLSSFSDSLTYSVADFDPYESQHDKKKVMQKKMLLSPHRVMYYFKEKRNTSSSPKNISADVTTGNLESCFDGPTSIAMFTIDSIVFAEEDYYTQMYADESVSYCDGKGTNKINCDDSYEAFGGIHYETCMSDLDNQWVVVTSTFYSSSEDDIAMTLDTGICNYKACEARALIQFFSYNATMDVMKVENGPNNKNDGKLDDCLADKDTAREFVDMDIDLFGGTFLANLSDAFSSCKEVEKKTLYCDSSLDPNFDSDRLKCLEHDRQWVIMKVTTKDPHDGITVTLDNVGSCLPKNCDANDLAKKMSNPVIHQIKTIEDAGFQLRMKKTTS